MSGGSKKNCLFASNGINLELTSDTGSKWVEDYDGTLVQSPAGYPAIPGGRLATTLAGGAELGPELIVNGDFSDGATGWTVGGEDATHIVTFADGKMRYQSDTTTPELFVRAPPTTPFVAGKFYELTVVVTNNPSGSVKMEQIGYPRVVIGGSGPKTYKAYFQRNASSFVFTRNTVNVDITFDSISVREVIPTWLPTDESGNLIAAVQRTFRTPNGVVQRYDETWSGVRVEPERTNLVYPSEYNTTTATTTGGCANSTLQFRDGVDSSAIYIEDNDPTAYAYVSASLTVATYTISAYIQMDDGSEPVVGNIPTVGDFCIVANNSALNATFTIRQVESTSIYRVSAQFTGIADDSYFGIIKYDTQTAKGLKFSGLQVELGEFATSYIPTTDSTVTRPSDDITFPTPQWAVNNKQPLILHARIKPHAAGQGGYILSSYVDSNNATSLVLTATEITLRKRLSGSNTDVSVSYTHGTELIDVMAYLHPTLGMGISTREYDAGWGAWETWQTDADTDDPAMGLAYSVGSTGNDADGFSGHVAADFPWHMLHKIPANLTTAAQVQAYAEGLANAN